MNRKPMLNHVSGSSLRLRVWMERKHEEAIVNLSVPSSSAGNPFAADSEENKYEIKNQNQKHQQWQSSGKAPVAP
jgi:hypothetical protein